MNSARVVNQDKPMLIKEIATPRLHKNRLLLLRLWL